MTATKIKKNRGERTEREAGSEPPWNVILHNDWENSMPRVVVILGGDPQEGSPRNDLQEGHQDHVGGPHASSRATVKQCYKELAEPYKELLRKEGLTISIEPDG